MERNTNLLKDMIPEATRKISVLLVTEKVCDATYHALHIQEKCKLSFGRWIVDSGATEHMSPYKQKFEEIKEQSAWVSTANGQRG